MYEYVPVVSDRVQSPSELEEQICNWLIDRVAEHVGLSPLDIDSSIPFADYGLGSAEAVILSGDLERWLGRSLSPTLLWDYPTIDALATYLAYEN